MTQHNDSRALIENALRKIKRLNNEIAELENRHHEPIAIVGIGCRFPGAETGVEQFWRNLCEGVDSVIPLAGQRWDQQRYFDAQTPLPGKTYSPNAGLLDDVLRFDAELFGITPREAECMDPQQRILLEVTWQALEDACMAPDKVRGARAGVFTGIMNKDHSDLLVRHLSLDEIAAHMNAGNHESVHSGRVSYTFDFKGPCVTLNTACSSSLVSVHLACQSLRQNECDFALAGGCNVMLAPATSVAQSQAMMHSPEGRCKAFDAAANGYVRAEGCGVLVLKRLSRALADGDSVYAVIRGSAVNQDGLSQGIMAPNGPAQVRVIRSALENARVSPGDIGYVEAHGTGTRLGDPIELQALGSVYGHSSGRVQPLLVGSVKTNIGHSESAAGIAGIIKVAKALQQGEIPPQLHFNEPNPFIDFSQEHIRICERRQAWPASTSATGSRLAGVSSFGFSGTNAHLILESFEPAPRGAADHRKPHLLCISAREPAALKAYIPKLVEALASSAEQDLADICYSLNTGRRQFDERLAVSGNSRDELIDALHKALAQAPSTSSTSAGPRVGWLMSPPDRHSRPRYLALCEEHPVLRQACQDFVHASALLPARTAEREQRMNDAALVYGFAMLWRALGIKPQWIASKGAMRHVAAAVLGDLSLQQASAAFDDDVEEHLTSFELRLHPCERERRTLPALSFESLAQALANEPVGTTIAMGAATLPWLPFPQVLGEHLVQIADSIDESPWLTVARALANLYQAGAALDFAAWDARPQPRRLSLPTYAFQGRRYWLARLSAANDESLRGDASPASALELVEPTGMTAREYVKYLVRALAKMEEQPLADESLLIEDMGFDSLMLAELRTRMEKAYPDGGRIPLDLLHSGQLGELLDFVDSWTGHAQAKPEAQGSNERDQALHWLAQWKGEAHRDDVQRMDKRHVHKASERNVLLGDIAAIGDSGWYAAQLFHDGTHPFFYEHAQDHIPGLYLIEAARQFGLACAHLFQGVPHEFPFVLDDMRIRFDGFAEQDSPVYLIAEYTDLMFRNGYLHRSHSRCHVVQHGVVLGTIEGHGLILQPAAYQAARTLENAL